MESRVLTDATVIRGLSLIQKPLVRFIANCSVPTLKPTRLFNDGRNLIGGKQLRPAILLEASLATEVSPMNKRKCLLPCLAAASSLAAGSDSTGAVGFFQKYLGIVTRFFFFTRYFLNVIFNILNKKIFNPD